MGLQEFTDFYKKFFTEDDWSNFITSINTKLPSALRVTDTKFKEKIFNKLSVNLVLKNQYFKNVFDTIHRGQILKDFIINQTNIGNIQRQEVVSMLPVLLMGLKNNYSVLDMCAAPGSKTKQLLEISDFVVANDCNYKRLNVLVTETCKIPRKGFLVLKHDASSLPVFKNDFDRVLCDVPCSGDGTARKNPTILTNWKLNSAIGLSNLQYRILKHSLKFIKDTGLVIYSTCSLNPIENECIINKIINEEDLEIIDLRENIDERISKEFVFRDGMTEIKEYGVFNEELKKCIRVYPHDNNTGGFFITGLRKKQNMNKERTKSEIVTTSNNNSISDISEECRKKLQEEFDISEKIIIYKNKSKNTLYEVSDDIYKIMMNNKLNIIHCGYKIFEKCTLSETGYRMKNIPEKNDKFDIELSGKEVIENKSAKFTYQKGNVIVKLSDFDIKIAGFSHGEKVNLYISNNLQKALLDFY
ncbi:NOL1/NOP2/sun family protein [Vairimorpha necatrix]|uniref:NOL1/NOP2/sun family protein n=1 Tax=Vairimorpha necatrix TaxID=6039 RepID=A0AAX4JE34_9MICR